jgi:tol-pal system protein YbgF
MIQPLSRALAAFVLAASFAVASASAQEGGGLLDRIFAPRGETATDGQQVAQVQQTDLVVRLERLEAQIRQLTGVIEQLQHRNQQLEQEVRRLGGGAPPPAQAARPQVPPVQAAPAPVAPAAPPPAPGRRSDVFDPAQNPNAPGAPQTLGGLPSRAAEPLPPIGEEAPPVGAPGGRDPGAPLDLSTMASAGGGNPPQPSTPQPAAPLPPPPARNPSGTGAVAAVAPPSETPKDHYDLGYGYVLRKDYALAEDTFQAFLKKYPNDRMAPDAQFWLGESLFQRQRYDGAAEQFLALSTKYEGHGKAADALLRLGQSLAALNQKEMACATFAEVSRKYPRASASVKQGVEREQKRARC